MIEETLDLSVPMVLMTILWPIVFSILNKMHNEIKLAPWLFYMVIIIHVISCLVAAIMVGAADYVMVYSSSTFEVWGPWGIAGLTLLTGVISVMIYASNIKLFKESES